MAERGIRSWFLPDVSDIIFCYVVQKSSVTVHKTTHWVVLFTAFEPLSLRRLEKERTTRLGGSSFLAEREGFEPSCACAQTDFESAPLWPLRYLSINMMQQRASYLWSPIRCGSGNLLSESTSHSQLGGRGACSPDAELANPRRRRYISPWCILYIFIFDTSSQTCTAAFSHDAIYYSMKTFKMQDFFEKYPAKENKMGRKEYYIYCKTWKIVVK